MNEQWQIIEGDDHVISFINGGSATVFKTGQIREQVKLEINKLISQVSSEGKISILLANALNLDVVFKQLTIYPLSDLGIENCELLLLGNSIWQKGELKINVMLEATSVIEKRTTNTMRLRIPYTVQKKVYESKVILEFLPEIIEQTPIDTENSLDDIRQEIYR